VSVPVTGPRTRRIRQGNEELRQILEFVLEAAVEQSNRTSAALIATGYDEADVQRLIMDWWLNHAADELRALGFDIQYQLGLAKVYENLVQAWAAEDRS
jgi:hypothetical protein